MGDVNHTMRVIWDDGAEELSGDITITGDNGDQTKVTLAAEAADVEVDVAFDRTKVQGLFAQCDGDVTIKTNSSGAPQDTIALAAKEPLALKDNAQVQATFAGNVTKLYLSSTAGGKFTMKKVTDVTP